MIPVKIKHLCGAVLMLCFFTAPVLAGSIRSTVHNLSISGPGPITATSETRICVFCHIPHRQGPEMPYLWNRYNPTGPYTPYYSTTMKANVGQPTGSSRMCLSCHDGTIALGAVTSSPDAIPFKGGVYFMPENSPSNLGTNLSDDHPISFVYDKALTLEDPSLRDPALLPPKMRLDDSEVQCITCHDPHDNTFGDFLVMDNTASSLCIECHDIRGWTHSSHALSTALLDRSDGLWPNTHYATVAENGCENCHIPHSAGTKEWLLIFNNEQDNCLACHSGKIASTDIAAVLAKRYNHPVLQNTGVHDPTDITTAGSAPQSVECTDCHNPHQANADPSPGDGRVSGATRGVPGISASGQPISDSQYVYQICFKCHGDNNVMNAPPITRQINTLDLRKAFDPANPSFHPVEVQGKNPDVPSLLPPYTVSSIISCTDCHGNNDPSQPSGPHGSFYQYILTDRYVTADYTTESPSAYALCYKCHSRSTILNDDSFPHRIHVVQERTPCSACHDPHGVSYTQGSAMHNSHLINFDLNIVSPDYSGRLEYDSLGPHRGECFLRCHGVVHSPLKYPQ